VLRSRGPRVADRSAGRAPSGLTRAYLTASIAALARKASQATDGYC
jgi:hypothetical protein